MAAETTTRIYELQVKLAQDSLAQLKKLQASTKDAEKRMGELSGMVKSVGASLLASFSVGAIMGAVQGAISAVDELGAAAQRVGMGVESFSALTYAAQQSDMAMADLETGLKELQKSMVETGTKGANVLDALGIDKTQPQLEVLKEFAEKFKTIHDPALRTNALLEVFGKAGLKLRPLLEQGGVGIEELMKKAKELGFVLSEETAKGFSDLDNAIKDAQGNADLMKRNLTEGLTPALLDVMSAFKDSAQAGDQFKALGGVLGIALRVVAGAALTVLHSFQQLGVVIYGVGVAMQRVATLDFKGAKEELLDMDRRLAENSETYSRQMEKIAGVGEATADLTAATDKNTKSTINNNAAVRAALTTPTDVKEKISAFEKLTLALDDQLAKLKQVDVELPEFAKAVRAAAESMALLNPLQQAHVMILLAEIAATEQLNKENKKRKEDEQEIIGIIKSHRTEEEKFYDDIKRYLELMNKFPETADKMGEAIERRTKAYNDSLVVVDAKSAETSKLLEALADKVDGYAKSISGSLVDFATGAQNAKFSFSDFATSVIRDLMKMTMQLLIIEPLMKSFKTWLTTPSASSTSSGGTENKLFGAAITAAVQAYMGQAKGGVFTSPSLSAFSGGIYDSPHTFAFASGAGVFAEAGPEAIMPLKRSASGTLGVDASGAGVVVNVVNQSDSKVGVESKRSGNGEREITILIQKAVMDGFARGRFDGVMGATYGVTRRGH